MLGMRPMMFRFPRTRDDECRTAAMFATHRVGLAFAEQLHQTDYQTDQGGPDRQSGENTWSDWIWIRVAAEVSDGDRH